MKSIKAVEDPEGEIFQTQISTRTLDDSNFVTLKLQSGNYLRFQADTGAQCNVVPLHIYKEATKDVNLVNVMPLRTPIKAYGDTTLPVVGSVLLKVQRGNVQYKLDCKLVDHRGI